MNQESYSVNLDTRLGTLPANDKPLTNPQFSDMKGSMADELDRKLIPELVQTALTLSLGAMSKSMDMLRRPQQSANTIVSETKELFTIPADAGEGIQAKLQGLAAVWMEKGVTLMEECRSEGQKFTDDKTSS